MLLNTYEHHYTKTFFFFFSIFVSISRPRSAYIVSMEIIFHFIFIFIITNHIILLKQTHLFYCESFKHGPLFLGDNMDEER